jgi:hypothetical protein
MVSLTTTISTPTNFVEYAKSIDENDPTRAFVENMVDESDVMRAIPILPAERGKRAYMDIGSLPAVGFRGFNEAATRRWAASTSARRIPSSSTITSSSTAR